MSDRPEKRLLLVDGSSYLYRAFHALPPLTNSRGEATGAVYGVINMLRTLLREYAPDYLAVVFDAKGRTFRDEIFEQYKAHRPPMPEELQAQIEPLHQIVRAMGLPCLAVEGVEADDVIGTLARQARKQGLRTVISTGDKDMAQLVNEDVTLVNTMSNTILDARGVEEKFGVRPDQIVDWLALVGDSSDNIPGIPGVGPKTAAKWLRQYGSLDALVAHAHEIKGKTGEKLRAHLDQLELSRRLAAIKCDVPLEVSPEDLRPAPPDRARLRELYQRLEFRRWLEELLKEERDNPAPATAGDPPPAYEVILDEAALAQWMEKLEAAEAWVFDTETTSLSPLDAEIVGLSFAVAPGEAAYVPLAHAYPGAPAQLDRARVLERLRPLLEDPARPLIGQNLKYDLAVLARHGIRLAGMRYDTMLESYVLDSTASQHDMDSLALKYLGRATIHYEDIAGKGSKQLTFDQIPVEQAAPYAAEDADVTLQLHRTLWPRLAAEPGLRRVFEEIEMPLIPVLAEMERHGVLIDCQRLARLSEELEARMARIADEAYRLAGGPFNLASPKQIQEILYERQGLPVIRRTPKGQPSTAEGVLQELARDYPLPRLILDYRALSKLKSTYTDRLPEQVHPATGRVHTSYHQAVAATGRLSSSNPNLQNIPVRSEEGRRIRQAFIAPPGRRLLAADYSQIELRILAHLSGDRRLLQAFREGIDIHRATAAEIFGVAPEAVTGEQRRHAKAINFGLVYGMSAFGLGRQLGIERGAAQEYMDLYFARYPGVKRFMDEIRDQAHAQGYVETLFGRRLYLPEINSRNHQRRQYAERAAINAPMQGTAADIIKRAMLGCRDWLAQSDTGAAMIMQVHDELVFEVPETAVEAVTQGVRRAMEGAAELAVPLVVDIGCGANWDEAH
ncbi:MAG TPA: DNA polymerase I [Gammaproteobacteria bacterium]|nr:DNA polymerase I [Gammaproteobacteria bacterium]